MSKGWLKKKFLSRLLTRGFEISERFSDRNKPTFTRVLRFEHLPAPTGREKGCLKRNRGISMRKGWLKQAWRSQNLKNAKRLA